jgi:hypothetical protein
MGAAVRGRRRVWRAGGGHGRTVRLEREGVLTTRQATVYVPATVVAFTGWTTALPSTLTRPVSRCSPPGPVTTTPRPYSKGGPSNVRRTSRGAVATLDPAAGSAESSRACA